MHAYKGIKIVNGIAIGKIKLYKAPVYEISDELVSDIKAEIDRFEAARVKVQEQQNALYEKEMKEGRKDTAGIFLLPPQFRPFVLKNLPYRDLRVRKNQQVLCISS